MANRSTIGLSCCCYATRTVNNGTVTYSDGVQLPGAVQADISIKRDTVQKFADNELIYEENNFKGGTLTLTEVAWPDDDYATLTGNDYTNSVLSFVADPQAPYVAFGMIEDTLSKSSGSWSKSYTAVFLPKVKFADADSSAVTRGDSTSFSDPSLVGTIYKEIDDNWRQIQTFTTYAAAQSWLFTLMDISA